MKRAFTLIEILVVITIITVLMGIIFPAMGKARLQAQILAVNAELRDIGIALEAYAMENNDKYPPTRVDCSVGEHYYQLPTELVKSQYLPQPDSNSFMAAGIEDRFNPGYTYKYRSTGTLIYNRTVTINDGSYLWVPDGFPDDPNEQEGQFYYNQKESPVSWVLYSQGPGFDLDTMRENNYPVPKNTWYDPKISSGVIVRMRLQNGRQLGTFEN